MAKGLSKSKPTKRLTLDLTEEFHVRLTELEGKVGIKGKVNIVRQALQLYEYMVERTLDGDTFTATDKSGTKEKIVFLGPMR